MTSFINAQNWVQNGIQVKIDYDFDGLVIWRTAWSPDGKWIALSIGNDIWLVSVHGGEPVNVTKYIVDPCGSPNFSPDGSEVTFTRYLQRGNWILKYNIDGVNIETGEHRNIIENGIYGVWSRNGRYFIYIDTTNESYTNFQFAMYDQQKDTTECLNHIKGISYCELSISPDNSHIVTTLQATENQSNEYTMVSIPLNGDKAETLPIEAGHIFSPRYSPDGKWILYNRFSYYGGKQYKGIYA